MIKLIATDIDGTLIKESSAELYPEIHDEIRRLLDMGIMFCAASGRQYGSASRLFGPVKDELIYIVDNGAHVRYKGEDLIIKPMDMDEVKEIADDIRAFGNMEIVSSTTEGCFLETNDKDFCDLIMNSYHNVAHIVDDITDVGLPIIKLAAYQKGSIFDNARDFIMPKWRDRCRCVISGKTWVDFMDFSVDKGNALCYLQNKYNISPEETMAFGDNENDMGMLRAAKYSYAVDTAMDPIKECAAYTCPGYEQRGVLEVLKGIK